jgi:uncharacterized protein (UPF0335 family)
VTRSNAPKDNRHKIAGQALSQGFQVKIFKKCRRERVKANKRTEERGF